MKIQFLLSLLIFFGCETKTKNSDPKKLKTEKASQFKIDLESRKFFIGDVNNDKVNDTAYVNLKRNIETGEIECGGKNCYINIEFKNSIPKISFDQSLGVSISKTEDLNNDKANEIIIFSRTHEGWWNYISVMSFDGKNWNELAVTKAFVSDDEDFENRIIKKNGKYFLVGENQWEEDENGDFKKVIIKI
ncbi:MULTISPECIES: hypothetical protein [Flavobacterium]|uniref:hypothetical protein n=1 Tax=Flavobacterium TaxID=237 RepID=UPI001FCCAAE1|nr:MULTISPECIES: hypothetical protein [Flavobacterium]UOK42212.1 hypothetical protein LZF87_12945 [Flavobacterium enshiense]